MLEEKPDIQYQVDHIFRLLESDDPKRQRSPIIALREETKKIDSTQNPDEIIRAAIVRVMYGNGHKMSYKELLTLDLEELSNVVGIHLDRREQHWNTTTGRRIPPSHDPERRTPRERG